MVAVMCSGVLTVSCPPCGGQDMGSRPCVEWVGHVLLVSFLEELVTI